jgi:hypothetical protein
LDEGEFDDRRRGMVGIRMQNHIRRFVGRRTHADRARRRDIRRLE